jgi:hypothetical protein
MTAVSHHSSCGGPGTKDALCRSAAASIRSRADRYSYRTGELEVRDCFQRETLGTGPLYAGVDILYIEDI